MTTSAAFEFRWFSLLGLSVVLFLGFGLICLIFGILGPGLVRRGGPGSQSASLMKFFVFSARADTAYFGRPPVELAQESPAIAKLHVAMLTVSGGFLVSLAIIQFGLVWFGLRNGQSWALWTLAIGDLALAVQYWLVVMPPYAIYASVAIPIATLLGWLSLR
jgi:hypothetical protein